MQMIRISQILAFTLVTLGLIGSAQATTEAKSQIGGELKPVCETLKAAIAVGSPKAKLDRFLLIQWKHNMSEFPDLATYVGEPGQNDRYTDYSLASIDRRKKEKVCQLEILKKISSAKLAGEDKINFELEKRNLEVDIEGQKFDSEYLVLNHLDGVHSGLADLLAVMPTAQLKDYENMIARISLFPALVDQQEVLLREGMKKKVTAVAQFLKAVPPQIDHLTPANVEDSPYYKVFKDIGIQLTPVEKEKIQKRAKDLLVGKVYPRLQKFKKFIVEEYIPAARQSISLSDMPNGVEWYNYLVRYQTTTKMTADELHQLGLKEVERISKEMTDLRNKLNFKGTSKDFTHFLLTDPQFFYTKKEDLLTGYRDIAKRIDPELPKIIGTLPRLTYGVREMPEFKSKEETSAYYQTGAPDSGRAGDFYANLYDLKSRPKWAMESLTMHEAVPGHHLQISLAQELKGLPKFRTQGFYTAYVEGWGLYAEFLGEEMGFYKDPYSKYGELSNEMWRAVRLVVDTGMHSKNWSRQQSIDYMKNLVPKSQLEVEVEIDRYATWPAQALAYKVGQLKILELRSRAKNLLGEKFNIREFHDEILKHGALPMDVLEKVINEWITSTANETH